MQNAPAEPERVTGKLALPDVTLVGIDTICHDLTAWAADDCMRCASFGDVKIFTNVTGMPDGVCISGLADGASALRFKFQDLSSYIKTKNILFFQWDGWIVNPSLWRPEFLEYDFIGAPWWYTDGRNVGNGGFALQSKALMDFIADNLDRFPVASPEDDVVCRKYRPALEAEGFRWAPEDLAHQFSFECSAPHNAFGYHAMRNWLHVLDRYALIERARVAARNPYVCQPSHMGQLLNVAPWLRAEIGM